MPPQRSQDRRIAARPASTTSASCSLVAVVLGAAALVADGSGVPRAVDRQLLRALCIVRGGDCEQDRAPCAVAQRSPRRRRQREDPRLPRRRRTRRCARGALRRHGRGHRRLRRAGGPRRLGEGAHVAVALGRGGLGLGGELTAAAGRLARARLHLGACATRGAADALVGRLRRARGDARRGASRRRARARAGAALRPRRPRGQRRARRGRQSLRRGRSGCRSQDVAGARIDARTGRRTLYVAAHGRGLAVAARTRRGGRDRRARRPRALRGDLRRARAPGRPHGADHRQLSAARSTCPRACSRRSGCSRRPPGTGAPTSRRPTSTSPTPRACAWRGAFLEQVRHPGAVRIGAAVAVAAALRRRLDDVGVVHARTYDADERRYGVDGSVGVDGVQLGASLSRTLLGRAPRRRGDARARRSVAHDAATAWSRMAYAIGRPRDWPGGCAGPDCVT